jgi:flagellar motor switch protein FliM
MTKATEQRHRTVRRFDFRRPSKLNRDHVRTLEIVQETFARQFTTVLSSSLRVVANVSVEAIEQLTYDEFVRATPNPTNLSILSIQPLPGVALLQLPLSISYTAVDLLLGGPGKNSDLLRPMSDIENALLRDLLDRILAELKYAFESVVTIEPAIVQIESNPQFAQIAAPSDMIVVVTFDVRVNTAYGRATLAFPYTTLAPVLDSFTGNVVAADRDSIQARQARIAIADHVHETPVTVAVRFKPVSLTAGEIDDLAVGDIIPLSQPTTAPLLVTVANQTAFLGLPARRGKRLACQITTPLSEVPS